MIVKSFNGSLKASFFIARIGQVGKPLWVPYTANNSFMVFSQKPEIDFQRVKAAYESGAFNIYKLGSCQQSIRITDVRVVIARCENMNERHLIQLTLLEKHIAKQKKLMEKQKQLLQCAQKSLFANC